MTIEEASDLIKKKCLELGFSACGIARAEAVDQNAVREHEDWLQKGYAADMDYLHRNKAMRYDPRLLEPGAKSLICVAMNYYPKQFVESDVSFACYSYGKDYHYVLKSYLSLLLKYIKEEVSLSGSGMYASTSSINLRILSPHSLSGSSNAFNADPTTIGVSSPGKSYSSNNSRTSISTNSNNSSSSTWSSLFKNTTM